MQTHYLGKLARSYFDDAVKQATTLLSVPTNAEIYFLSTATYCADLGKHFPKHVQAAFQHVCNVGKVSFSFTYKNKNIVVLYLTKHNQFLKKNKEALLGLLLHELMHLVQMRQGLYACLQHSFAKVFPFYQRRIKRLHLRKAAAITQRIGQTSLLLVKDLYANSALLEKGHGRYLHAYYMEEFKVRKTCPQPIFYEALKQALKEDITLLETVFTFEFSLLSVLLPFQKYEQVRGKALVKHIERCYRIHLKEVAEVCGDLVDFYVETYKHPSVSFEKKYLHLVFQKVSALLQ